MKKIVAAVLAVIIIISIIVTCSAEPKLVISNAYKHRGTYTGNYSNNTYTFEIKNKSHTKDIVSVDSFSIYFYDKHGNVIGSWDAGRSDLNKLALDARDSMTIQIDVPESILPYSEKWSYDTEYVLNYYD